MATASPTASSSYALSGTAADDAPSLRPSKSFKGIMQKAEISRLRRFFLPIVYLRNYRRRRERHLQKDDFTPPSKAELVRHIVEKCPYIGKWPEALIEEMVGTVFFSSVLPGELLTYKEEPVMSHGLILLLRGAVVVYEARPLARGTQQQSVNPDDASIIAAPAVLGELLCLTDGINVTSYRALRMTDFAFINAAVVRRMITARLTPAMLASTFPAAVRLARKAVLERYFTETIPMMLQSWVFAEMTLDEVQTLIEHLTPEVALPGEVIVTQGAVASTMYFIRRGEARVVVGGKPIPGAVLSAGKAFGEMGVLFHERRMATVEAVSVCDLWVLAKSSLDRVLLSSPNRKKIIFMAASKRTSLIASNPRDGIVAALAKHSVFSQTPPHVIQRLVTLAQPQVFPAGTILAAASTFADRIIILQNGHATSQDAFRDSYGASDVVGVLCARPHLHLATIAATMMVDAFVVPRRVLVGVMKRAGCLEPALRESEVLLRLEADRRGVEISLARAPDRSLSFAQSTVDTASDGRPAPSLTRRPSMAEAKAQRYVQTDLSLWQNTAVSLSAQEEAARAAQWLLTQPDAGSSVTLGDLSRHEAALASIRLSSLHDSSPRVSSRTEAAQLWAALDDVRALVQKEKTFLRDLGNVPSHRQLMFIRLSKKMLVWDDGGANQPPMSQPLTAAVPDEEGPLIPLLKPSRPAVNVIATPDSGTLPKLRPLYRPLRPHSYAPVLPQSVQPLTARELSESLSVSEPQPHLFGVKAMPPPDRRFVPSADEVDVFMAEILSGAGMNDAGVLMNQRSSDARGGTDTAMPEQTKDRDYFNEAWEDINMQIRPLIVRSHAIYPPVGPYDASAPEFTLSQSHWRDSETAAVFGGGGPEMSLLQGPVLEPLRRPTLSKKDQHRRRDRSTGQHGGHHSHASPRRDRSMPVSHSRVPPFLPARPVTIHDEAFRRLASPRQVVLAQSAKRLARQTLATIRVSGGISTTAAAVPPPPPSLL